MISSTNSVHKLCNLIKKFGNLSCCKVTKITQLLSGVFLLTLLMLSITAGSYAGNRATPRLSFSATPKVVKIGHSLVFKGRLRDRSGRSLGGKIVLLQRKDVKRVTKIINGKTKKVKRYFWRNLKRKRTNSRGVYIFRLKPKKSATYRVKAFSSGKRKKPPATESPSIPPPVVSPPVVVVVTPGPMADRLGFAVGNKLVWLNDQDLASQLDGIAALGVKWIRHDMDWSVIQPDNSTSYNWSRYDRLVSEVNKRNIKILPILTYTPRWARVPAAIDSMFSAPANPDQFASFAANAVKRYAPLGIHEWEIWNEPNIEYFWRPLPNVSAYTALLKTSYASIKQADPSAKVISGGLSPAVTDGSNISPRDFVSGMYANGAKNYFDVLGHHPYCALALPSDYYSWSAWSQMSDTNPSIRSIMTTYDDSNKPIWATEFGKPTNGISGVSESLQAQAIEDAAKQMQDKPWLQKLFIYSYKDLSNDTSTKENFYGVVRYDGSYKPAYFSVKNLLSN